MLHELLYLRQEVEFFFNYKSRQFETERLIMVESSCKFEIILEAYMHRGYDTGARSIYMTLLYQPPPIVMNVKKIRRLMKNMV